jgi:adenosylmethionine-8-amino-7-oxononanoate aminotransferase
MDADRRRELAEMDHAHVWHPFTPMQQWRMREPLIIESADGDELIDTHGNRYIDGIASMWANVHGHRVLAIDQAIRDQLDQVAHCTMLGQGNVPATLLAPKLAQIAPGDLPHVFYSDSGATATEVAFKMAVGYWYHTGQPQRDTFIALKGAYHGDTTAAMSIGYSELFHRPFKSMVFHTEFVDPPDTFHGDIAESCCQRSQGAVQCTAAEQAGERRWSIECGSTSNMVVQVALQELRARLTKLGDRCAGVVVEPLVQGAAGMVIQPRGYLAGVQRLCREHGTLLIADEVATGFGRTGRMFACDHEAIKPDLLAVGKGITGGYLPLAATLATDAIADSFEGELHEFKTLYHGHTYTGNPLAAAAALASIELFDTNDVLTGVVQRAAQLADKLDALRDAQAFPFVADVRQCGLMVGIELASPGSDGGQSWLSGGTALGDFGETADPNPPRRLGYDACEAAREHGVIVRPLGDVVVLMPPLAITPNHLDKLADVVIACIGELG